MTETSCTALVCAHDDITRRAVGAAVEDAGYQLLGETASALDMMELVPMTEPDLIVLDNDLPSRLGVEWLPELRAAVPRAAVLLLANDEHIHERATQEGAFGVVYKTELHELEGALARAWRWLNDPELRKPLERRRGGDRRQGYDWSQVTHERRGGEDRRKRDIGPPGTPTNP